MRGLYGIADAGTGGDPLLQIEALLAGGCRLVQLRCKGWDADAVRDAARDARALTAAVGALFVLNDHPGIAAEVGADGAHVGQADLPAAEARALLGERALLGVSHNTPEELTRSLALADYVAVGPMWDTSRLSRPKPVRGLALLEVARGLTSLPLVAIGGITPDRVASVRAAGADAWAVIGAIAAAPDRVAATRAFTDLA